MRLIFAAMLLLTSVGITDVFAEVKIISFISPSGQKIEVSAIDFPKYGDGSWQFIGDQYRLADGFPYFLDSGIIAAYRKNNSLIFEIFSGLKRNYLQAIVYYPDGKTPHFFQKMNLVKEGLGVVFQERPLDLNWTPERLFR